MKVLIVDDDLISQLVLKRTLEQSGHEVILTRSGTEALKAFQDDAISVVISDWRMPEMDGVELCQTIRSVRKMNYTYFILVSSTRLTPEKYAHAVGMGVDDFLLKPLNRDEVPVRLLVAERIINSPPRSSALRRCCRSACTAKRSATTAITGSRSRAISARRPARTSPTASAPIATRRSWSPISGR